MRLHSHVLTAAIATIFLRPDGVEGGSTATATQSDAALGKAIAERTDALFLIDNSGSMNFPMPAGSPYEGLTRRQAMEERMTAFIGGCLAYDKNGVDIAFFNDSGKVTIHEGVDMVKFQELLKANQPDSGTLLATPLQQMIDLAKSRYAEKNQLIFCFTDGQPSDQDKVKAIIKAQAAKSNQDKDERLNIGFIQVGDDEGATKFLTFLDDGIANDQTWDIVNRMNIDELRGKSVEEIYALTQQD